ncbi:MAG: uroporphyrinogen decarboxylase family protein [Phycisphaerae bacterium]
MLEATNENDRFQPDYRQFEAVMRNQRPARLPLYEHIVSPRVMEKILGESFADLEKGDARDRAEFSRQYCRFFRTMRYDVVTFEVCITTVLPDHGAIVGGRPGPIQTRADFDRYPWDQLPSLFWAQAQPQFEALCAALPEGMKAVGGVGNGVFEIAEDLVGLEYLPFMQVDDPDLYADLFVRIGDTMAALWREFLARHASVFVACRFGDDLGFRSSLLTNPETVRRHILLQYKRLIDQVHAADLPLLWHSCGCIFEIMDDVIALGIDAKHSNEDAIAPFGRWIEDYGDRIGLLGGFDMDFLCTALPEEVRRRVLEDGRRFRQEAKGYALGSGNSIPDYVPTENYLAMVRAGWTLQQEE